LRCEVRQYPVDGRSGTMDRDPYEWMSHAEFDAWHIYTVESPVRKLRVRYRNCGEIRRWQDGPNVRTALQKAKRQGWRVYDREPGIAPGEYIILHLIREGRWA